MRKLGEFYRQAPALLPPDNVSWYPVGIAGGPVHDVVVSHNLEYGGQRVAAGGHEVFISDRGTAWVLPR